MRFVLFIIQSLPVLAEAGDCHLMIIQGVSEIRDTILGVCFMYTTHEISWHLDASSFSLGEFWFGRGRLEVKHKFDLRKLFIKESLIPQLTGYFCDT
jgi:hypothetical protein